VEFRNLVGGEVGVVRVLSVILKLCSEGLG
jgi:hypothetical protein